MKKILDYCFYRAAAFYKEWHDFFYPIPSDEHLIAGAIIAYQPIGFILLSIIILLFPTFGLPINKTIFFIVSILIMIVCVFLADEDKFAQLEKKYEHEKYKKLKGWLIVVYFVGSLFLMVLMAIIKNPNTIVL